MAKPTTFTALDLLDTILDFERLTPDPEDWSFEKQQANAPRYVRLQQIWSLMLALVPELIDGKGDMGEAIRRFHSGDFVHHRHPMKDYYSLVEEMEKTIAHTPFSGNKIREFSGSELQHNYCDLLNYYIKLKQLINSNSRVMEISYPYYFSYFVTSAVSNSISLQAGPIAHWLAMFIDPLGKSFTFEEMVEKYNYPEDDLTDLDIDWM